MKRLFGYVWKVCEVIGDADEIVSEDDMLLITAKPYGMRRNKYRCEVTSPYGSGKIGDTLEQCRDWKYECTHFEGKKRHLLRGNVELCGHTCEEAKNAGGAPVLGTHFHHIVMVYPNPLRDGSLSGYILSDANSSEDADAVLRVIKEKHGKGELKVFLHDGTYHSEN